MKDEEKNKLHFLLVLASISQENGSSLRAGRPAPHRKARVQKKPSQDWALCTPSSPMSADFTLPSQLRSNASFPEHSKISIPTSLCLLSYNNTSFISCPLLEHKQEVLPVWPRHIPSTKSYSRHRVSQRNSYLRGSQEQNNEAEHLRWRVVPILWKANCKDRAGYISFS